MRDLHILFYRIIALIMFIICLPLFVLLYFFVKATSPGPFIFSQKRIGKDKKPFWIYKIRTMVENAESLKSEVKSLNEADGPVFKIHDDPRYTKFGFFLAHTGLDELPQLWNIIKGEMSFVGPRPLPVEEAKEVPKKYERRFSVLPGITSPWVVNGSHRLSFEDWMELDIKYLEQNNLWYDIRVAALTILLILRSLWRNIKSIKAI